MKKKILLLLFLTLLVINCKAYKSLSLKLENVLFVGSAEDAASESQSPQDDELRGLDGVECIPDLNTYEEAVVVRVIDGDSIEVNLNGQKTEVRYIGINTPEYYSKDQKRALEATQANQELVAGQVVYLFRDQSEIDKYERLLRYVLTDTDFVNFELVRQGYAEAKKYYPDTACHMIFERAEEY